MNGTIDQTPEAAIMQRDAVMTLLIAQSQGLIQRLALLAGHEKAAVAGLVTIGQAMVVYARCTRPDPEVMASFDRVLASLSPALTGSGSVSTVFQVCVETGAYSGAIDACIRAGQDREQEAYTGVVEEAACLVRHLRTLLAAVTEPMDKQVRKTGVTRSLPSHR
jgi:hypothetical protein